MFDVYKIREDFPILKRKIRGKPLIYFDNAATSQKPRQVIEKIREVYENHYANIHRGIHTLSQEASELYENAHKDVAKFINAKDWREIIFTRNTTESINLIAYSYGLNNLKRGDKIVITIMEHHSNIVPWQFVSKKTGAKLEYVFLENYRLNLDELGKKVDDKTKIVAVTHMSNVLGTINPIKEIIEIAHKKGAIVVIDGAQSVPHMKVDVKKLDIDFLAFSSHKMLGPTGIGVLYGKEEILEKMEPFLYGGDMIKDVDMYDAVWNDLPWKFEAGTSNIVDGIVFSEAIKYLERIGMENIENYEKTLIRYFLDKYLEIKNEKIKLIGPEEEKDRGSVFSFVFESYHPHEAAKILDLEGIAVRSGYHCAHPLIKYLGIFEKGGTVRASLYLYNTKEEIDRFFEVIKRLIK
ncbi:MAG: cysteine desulfurase [Candidatus Nanoclepta minutus]|uniref:Cysteine desulfurase n=1 Tax=Candidatus Nanoclepta minutus TaxID=1940235 RepID=A0A397WRN0_9ARCH|nr:MAG: cysteine desulfurase [Candidatus Nanoclepta minutus]